MNSNEKRRQTIIEKYGSWEAYVEQRYLTPENREKARRAGMKGGLAKVGSFNDVELASAAGKKGNAIRWHGHEKSAKM